jgi:hypothetical protein
MAKRKKSRTKAKVRPGATNLRERGLDLGDQMRVMAVSDIEFNQALRDAGVFGCAYGLERIEGMSQPIPAITLIGERPEGFIRAFEHFERWGCLEDGDAVDVQMLLKGDGTYELWIGPETQRALYRTIPRADLYQAMALNVSWVKRFDSTHEAVRDLKRHCESGLRPVAIMAATGDPGDLSGRRLRLLKEWNGFVKFELRIIDEKDAPGDPRFAPRDKPANRDAASVDELSPAETCRRRNKTLDLAFPLSRERVRRSELTGRVRVLPGYSEVSEVQVVQAAVNLMLSDQLVPGDRHYSRISGDWRQKIWQAVADVSEVADGMHQPSSQPPEHVARQVALDVACMLRKRKLFDATKTFHEQQALFRDAGYVYD